MLKYGDNVNYKDKSSGKTSFFVVVSGFGDGDNTSMNFSLLDILLNNGAAVNATNEDGETCLILILKRNIKDEQNRQYPSASQELRFIVEDCNASLNCSDSYGRDPFLILDRDGDGDMGEIVGYLSAQSQIRSHMEKFEKERKKEKEKEKENEKLKKGKKVIEIDFNILTVEMLKKIVEKNFPDTENLSKLKKQELIDILEA